jgi:simple sugar transport system ATP-binding protein
MTTRVLELDGITKRFGALTANENISLHLCEGEMLALLGENGAGKTTLMNILFGHYTADAGEVRVRGKVLPPGRPRAAIDHGVGMVHQHFTLAGNLTVLENVMIGSEPLWRPGMRTQAARRRLMDFAERFELPVDPSARVADLSVGERQRVEILKALYRDARILILDEPTAVLARPEAARLFETLKAMSKEGLSIIFISHKLHEVMGASDRVTVLRGGRVVAERRAAETSATELAELMVGRRIDRPTRTPRTPGPVRLAARDVTVIENGHTRLEGASFSIREGEILGIVGVSGNGQATLGRLLSGLSRPTAGSITLDGLPMDRMGPRDLVQAGVGRIPEDRHAEGIIGDMTLWENAVLERIRDPGFSARGFVRRQRSRDFVAHLIKRFDIRGAGPDTRTSLMSGGNMQKLILARNLINGPRLILANQPTRGLDEGAIAAVHAELLAARDGGASILLISEELEEAVALADRIQAIVKGRLSPPVATDTVDAKTIGLMMAGAWDSQDAA